MQGTNMMGGLWSTRLEWNEERIELLKTRWAAGLSGSLIAEEFGVSRNAVIGKIHRLGLGRARGEDSGRTTTTKDRGWRSHRQPRQARRRPFKLDVPRFLKDIGDQATELPPETIADPVTLIDLQPHHCRWPVDREGEPMMYCGAAKCGEDYSSYCAAHHRLAFASARARSGVFVFAKSGRRVA
jgi:GcrA cell cycle regulator